MQAAIFPDNETSRLATLKGLDILDTPREDRFDRYTRIAARAFGVPIALISLIDSNRQWFKSAHGLDSDETPRDISFCGHAILGDNVFEVRDALLDPRFRDNPLVLDAPRIRYYAGAPLRGPNGHRLGTLCIIDSTPHELSDYEMRMLQNLADMVSDEMLREVDADSGRLAHVVQTVTAAEFFSAIPDEEGLSVLLFDIDDVLAAHDDKNSGMSPGEIFAQLLHDHFPQALSTAHIGDYHFCVLLKPDAAFDDVRAINRLCSDARKSLCFADGYHYLTPFVGRIQCDSEKYTSTDDMLIDAGRMFLRHERDQTSTESDVRRFLKSLVGWRRTIF